MTSHKVQSVVGQVVCPQKSCSSLLILEKSRTWYEEPNRFWNLETLHSVLPRALDKLFCLLELDMFSKQFCYRSILGLEFPYDPTTYENLVRLMTDLRLRTLISLRP